MLAVFMLPASTSSAVRPISDNILLTTAEVSGFPCPNQYIFCIICIGSLVSLTAFNKPLYAET